MGKLYLSPSGSRLLNLSGKSRQIWLPHYQPEPTDNPAHVGMCKSKRGHRRRDEPYFGIGQSLSRVSVLSPVNDGHGSSGVYRRQTGTGRFRWKRRL